MGCVKRVTHRDNRINDDKDNIRDTSNDSSDDTANSRNDGTLRQTLVNCNWFRDGVTPTILNGGCGLVVSKCRVEEEWGFVRT